LISIRPCAGERLPDGVSAGLPGLEKNREEVIAAAGAIIIRTVMETLGMGNVLVSDLGLREGVLIELARRAESRPLR